MIDDKILISKILENSKGLNLFSSKDRESLEEKHLPDSLAILDHFKIDEGLKVLDLGTGGGMPGLVLANRLGKTNFVLLDAKRKKIDALAKSVEDLDLKNVETLCGRFEELAHEEEYRETFDVVLAKAVASLPTLLEYACGFLKPEAHFYAWKGPNYKTELYDAKSAMSALSIDLIDQYKYHLPSGEERIILKFIKKGKTQEVYPRQNGKAKKKPL